MRCTCLNLILHTSSLVLAALCDMYSLIKCWWYAGLPPSCKGQVAMDCASGEHVQGATMFMVMKVLNSKEPCDCCLL